MTPAQVRRAARLYLLANTACLDVGGCETPEEIRVVWQAIEDARRALARYDLEPCQVGSVQACIDLATKGT